LFALLTAISIYDKHKNWIEAVLFKNHGPFLRGHRIIDECGANGDCGGWAREPGIGCDAVEFVLLG
jgi:hypothetical protein